jgi:hypothetical protein
VRTCAARTQRTARTDDHDLGELADAPRPGPTPRAQLRLTTRTAEQTTEQEPVDLDRVRTYHQQWVPPSTKRRPSHPAKEWGGPLRFQDVITLSSPTQKGNPEGLPSTPSSPSTTQNHLQILSQPDAQHPFNDSYEVSHTFLPSAFYWYVGVAVIIAVHIAAVILAHRHLSVRGADARAAHRSEYPWLVAMVGYTAFSLFLIAQPLVQEKGSSTEASGSDRVAGSTEASPATAEPAW